MLRDCLIAVLFATARQLQLSCGRNIDYVSEAESLIVGREKITNIFGYWPSFHDAEVLEFHLWRGNVDPDVKAYVFPVLTVKIHLWEITSKVDTRGYCVLRHRTLATLRFHEPEKRNKSVSRRIPLAMRLCRHAVEVPTLPTAARRASGKDDAALRLRELVDYVYQAIVRDQA